MHNFQSWSDSLLSFKYFPKLTFSVSSFNYDKYFRFLVFSNSKKLSSVLNFNFVNAFQN